MPGLLTSDLTAQLAELVALPGPAGDESEIASWISGQLEHAGLRSTIDALGNVVLAASAPGPPRVLVTAHMDQVGFIVSRIEPGHARCLAVGDPQTAEGAAEPVLIWSDRQAALAGTIEGREDGGAILLCDRLQALRVGDRVLFASPLRRGTGTIVAAAALDNRVGCLIVLSAALALGSSQDVAFAWTVREETEQSGVVSVARALQPTAVVAVDVTPATGREEGYESVVSCGLGPVITLLDEGLIVHRTLLRWFTDVAGAENIRWQPEVVGTGVSEAGQVHQTLGIPSLALLVAVSDMHTSHEVVDISDVADAIRLLGAALAGGLPCR